MTDKTDSKEREVAEQWLRDRYGAYRGHFAWRELEEAFLAGRASLAANAGSGPLIGQPQEMPDLSALTERGAKAWAGVDAQGLREGVANAGSKPVAPAGAGTWVHLKLMMEESAWDGTLQLSDALANIDDFAAAHPSPPEGMVGGWQDIATAPKDGTLILVHFGSKGVRAVSWGSPFHDEVTEENGIWCVDDDKHGPFGLRGYNDNGPTAPTHWRPLPPPPTTSAGSGKGE